MNTDEMKGKWQQLRGRVREMWGKLTDDDLDVIGGRTEQLVGKIRERYGYEKERAEQEVNSFMKSCDSASCADNSKAQPRSSF